MTDDAVVACIIVGWPDGREECRNTRRGHACLLDDPLPADVVAAIHDGLTPFLDRVASGENAPDPGPGWMSATTTASPKPPTSTTTTTASPEQLTIGGVA